MLAQKYVMKMGSNLFASLISFISLMVMTRYVGDEYGTMMWAWAFVAMFNAVSDMGFNLTNVKFIGEGRDRDKCLSTYLCIKLVMAGVMVLLTLASALFSFAYTHSMNEEALMVVLLFTLYYVLWDLQTVVTYTFDGRGENGKASLIFASEFLVRGVILIVLALNEVSAPVLSMGYLIGVCASLSVSVWMLRRTRPHLCRPAYIREYIRFTAPVAVSMLMVTVVEYMDKVIIGFSFDGREVGYYMAAAGIIWTFTNLGRTLNTVVLPQLPRYLREERGSEKVQHIVSTTERYLAILIFPVMVVMLLFGREIAVVFFGSGYEESGDVLSVQCFMLYATIVSALMTQILYATNNTRRYGMCTAIYVAVVLVCFLTLIPNYALGLGAVGAGLSMTIGYLFQAVILAYIVYKSTGIRFYSRLWRHVVAAVVDIAVLYCIDAVFDISGLFGLILISLFCLGFHWLVCAALGEFSRKDLRYFIDAVNPRNLKESIDEEMHRFGPSRRCGPGSWCSRRCSPPRPRTGH